MKAAGTTPIVLRMVVGYSHERRPVKPDLACGADAMC
jgi:hypothetical protein